MMKNTLAGLLIGGMVFCAGTAFAAVSQVPLFLTTGGKANVLVVLDNSNSMDEDATGAAVGSADPNSKSEISRGVIKNLITTYAGQLNMGLMAYRQTNVSGRQLHNAPYDVSFDPANYDPTFSGNRASTTKKYRLANSSSPGDYIHFNVNLPFYSNNNEGDAFCYSVTAEFDNGLEVPSVGPWDSYRCFRNKTVASDVLPTWRNTASESAAGFTTLIGQYTFSPTDSDYAQNILDFGRFMSWSYVSPTWFSNGSPGRGFLHTPIALLDSTQAGKLNIKLGTSQFSTNAPTDSAYPLQNAGLTPIEGTLLTAKDYFANNGWNNTAEGYTAACYPLPESCGHDYVILVTDGLPSVDASGNNTSGASALQDAADAAAALLTDGVKTYVVGFAMPYGTDATALNQLATAGGTTTALQASDTLSLKIALESIFDTIKKDTSTAAALAANSTRLNSTGSGNTTYIYQAKFNSADWSGSLAAFPLATDGSILAEEWSTDNSGVIPVHSSRNIYTWNGTTGLEFTGANFSNLSTSQQTDLVSVNNLNWIRGDSALEDGTTYRIRTKLLGDIINSTPAYVSVLDFNYDSLPATDPGASTYSAYVAANQSRSPMLYFGANDGMLHALKISSSGTSAEEKFAFIPAGVYPDLAGLTAPGYTHKYYVDGSPVVGDAYIDDVWNSNSGAAWRTVLIGTSGAGGKSIFALDVTDPDNFDSGDVMWEFTDADLGYTFGEPVVARLANGEWGVIFGSGYNSTSGLAYLYIVNAEDGTLIEKIATNADTANGLSSPTVLVDNERVVTIVYAGDLQGNLWKFDLSHSNPVQWAVDDNNNGSDPLFTARYGSTQVQPITSPLEISKHPEGGYMIYFGTGKYFEDNDNIVSGSPDIQSFYGIWDDLGTPVSVLDRSTLVEQAIQYEIENTVDGVTTSWRVTTQRPEDDFTWTATSNKTRGWFMDLVSPVNGAEGERVTTVPILRHGRVIFTTLIPSQQPCSPGGSSWLMELEALTGNRLSYTALDVDGDGDVDSDDMITITVNGVDIQVVPSGRKVSAIMTTPKVISASDQEYKYSGTSSGNITIITEKGGDTTKLGRQSWRQIR
ncbi:MAG: hypothetical protein GXP51_00530 [Deltaproteobacteria bacterium]|nr:hypothetical protein [Deltaproteobacteria bacterium]